MRLHPLVFVAVLPGEAFALKISSALNVIEYTPQLVAEDYYNLTTVSFVSGGVANIVKDTSVDLAANAETQALRQYHNNASLRIIWNICQATYRIVAPKKSSIKTLADLRGKRIGTITGTSAGYFVEKFLGSAGIKPNQYTVVSGSVCTAAPCGADTWPAMLAKGSIDAIGMWEPTIELAIELLGGPNKVVVFQDRAVYREIYNLHSTKEKLADPVKRRQIVAYLQALIRAQRLFDESPASVIPRVSKAVKVAGSVLEKVWHDHDWKGGLPDDLLPFLVEEDRYLAKVDKRTAATKSHLEDLIDDSVMKEALAGLALEQA